MGTIDSLMFSKETNAHILISVNILFFISLGGISFNIVLTSIIFFLKLLLLISKFKLYLEISFSNIVKVSMLGISKEISFINFDIIL